MKLYVIVIPLCLLSIKIFGQKAVPDSVEHRANQKILTEARALKIDSVLASFHSQTDSLKEHFDKKVSRIDSLKQRLRVATDSISANGIFSNNYFSVHRADSLLAPWLNKFDTLQEHSAKVLTIVDSIARLKDKTLAELDNKLQTLKDKTVGRLYDMNAPPEFVNKVNNVSSQVTNFQVTSLELKIPKLETSMHIGKMEDLNTKLVGDLDVATLQGAFVEPSKLTGNLGASLDVQKLVTGDPDELVSIAEATKVKAAKLTGLDEIKKHTEVVDEFKQLVQQAQNPDSIKELGLEQAKDIAVDHFAGKEEQLRQAMETLAKYKSKYPNLNSIGETLKRPPNQMKGKPWSERIIPGFGLHIERKGNPLLVEFNPYARFKFTSRISGGIGWNQSFACDIAGSRRKPNALKYGPRVFGELELGQTFSPRAEIELMNMDNPITSHGLTADRPERNWVWGAFVGVKKEYDFIKSIKGTVMVMLRIYKADHKRYQSDVVNVRCGFEFPMKKKREKG